MALLTQEGVDGFPQGNSLTASMSAPTEEATVSSLRATVTCLNKVAAYLSFLAGVSWLGLWLFGAPGNSYLSLSIAVVFLCNGYIFMLGSQKKAARKVE